MAVVRGARGEECSKKEGEQKGERKEREMRKGEVGSWEGGGYYKKI